MADSTNFDLRQIRELDEAIIVDDTDLMVVDTSDGTKKITREQFLADIYTKLDACQTAIDILLNQGVGGSSHLTKVLTVLGVGTIGGLKDGDSFDTDKTPEDILRKMLENAIPPKYIDPKLSLSCSTPSIVEIGSTVVPVLSSTFRQNDAGALISYKLYQDDVLQYSDSSITKFTDSAVKLLTATTYRAEVAYDNGPIKQNNMGIDDPTGRIMAGTIQSSLTITPKRGYWGFSATENTPPVSDFIRNKNITGLGPGNETQIKVVASATDRMVVFAYPATLRDCKKIRYEELNDDGNKTAFTQITLSIPDASKTGNYIDYRVYYYIGAIPFGSTMTFILTI